MKTIMNERLSISEYNPMRARFYDYDYFKYPWHFHSEYELMYVKNGSGKCFIGDKIEPYDQGDIILFGANLPHYMSSDEIYKKEGSVLRSQGTIIQFEFDFMRHSITYYPQFMKIKKLLQESVRGVKIKSNSTIQSLMDRIPLDSGIEHITNLLTLLSEIAKSEDRKLLCSQNYANTLSTFSDNRIGRVIAYVNNNYTGKILLKNVASLAAMNTSAFCRYFKEKTSKTFMQYIQELRIGYACKLLISNELTITQISGESGFETLSSFNRTFKQIIGVSPSEYKKQMI